MVGVARACTLQYGVDRIAMAGMQFRILDALP